MTKKLIRVGGGNKLTLGIKLLGFGLLSLGVMWLAMRVVNLTTLNFSRAATGTVYYVSTNGNDANPGTQTQPYRSINYGIKHLTAGDELRIFDGIYSEKLIVSQSGTVDSPIRITAVDGNQVVIDAGLINTRNIEITGNYINVSNLAFKNSTEMCVVLRGSNLTISNIDVSGCVSHGVIAYGKDILVKDSVVHDTVRENVARLESSGWGSALKMSAGSERVTFQGNRVFNNYGEGMAATRAINSVIKNNFFYDNFSVNVYVDNSHDIMVDGNLSACTTNAEFYRSGKPATAYAMGEEYYSGWGNQLGNITFVNNIAANCKKGFEYWGADSGVGGMRNVKIVNNTSYKNTESDLFLEQADETANTLVANNIFYSTAKDPWITSIAGITMQNNFWAKQPTTYSNARGTGDLYGEVYFATQPVYNNAQTFELASNSPAIDKGVATVFKYDYFSGIRPTANGFDMGAIESGAGMVLTPTPTPESSSPTPTPTPTSTPNPTPMPTPGLTVSSDTILPTVFIAKPLQGAVLSRGSVVGVEVNATDNVAISKIEFYVNGSIKTTVSGSSLRYSWNISGAKNKTYNLYAVAYDSSNNQTKSPTITVTAK